MRDSPHWFKQNSGFYSGGFLLLFPLNKDVFVHFLLHESSITILPSRSRCLRLKETQLVAKDRIPQKQCGCVQSNRTEPFIFNS